MRVTRRYRVKQEIHSGGFASIHEAYVVGDEGFERKVAIKRLQAKWHNNESVTMGFIDEARIVSQLHHSSVISILDFGMSDAGPFQVLEYVDGLNLEQLREQADKTGVPLTVSLYIVVQIAHALAHVHRATRAGEPMGIVHRDVSPRNILVSWDGDVKLVDFGIARANRRLEQTAVRAAKGTAGFMAPEQRQGGAIDGRADIYSLGCVLEYLTAERTVPEGVATLAHRASHTSADRRFQTAEGMATAAGAMLNRIATTEHRAAVREWLARLRPDKVGPAPHPVGDLFRLDLGDDDAGTDGEPPRTESVVLPAAQAASVALDVTEEDAAGSSGPPNGFLRLSDDAAGERTERTQGGGRRTSSLIGVVLEGALGTSCRLIESVEQAGAGRRFRATMAETEEPCAVFLLALTEGDAAALTRAARVAVGINHPNVIRVFDFGTGPDGSMFVATEPLEGRSLAAVGALPPDQVALIGSQLATAVGEAERAGLDALALAADAVLYVEDGPEVRLDALGLLLPEGARPASEPMKALGEIAFSLLEGRPLTSGPSQIREMEGRFGRLGRFVGSLVRASPEAPLSPEAVSETLDRLCRDPTGRQTLLWAVGGGLTGLALAALVLAATLS